jgi:predicted small metal-binding protein
MRAVECVVPQCGHIHASNDTNLVEPLLQHVREQHADESFNRQSAWSLIEAEAYDDAEHTGSKKSWGDFAGFVGAGGGGGATR